jgi:pimeloyl-ACP methyl ester carboxylesterase
VHVGHSTGGGEVVHYLARHGESRVTKAAIISAVPPLMVKTAANPGGLPKEVFDGFQEQLAANRAQFYYNVPAGPFYGNNRPGAKPSQGIIWNWWRQGMMGGARAHYDGIVAFSQTDLTEDLKKITVPVLVMHGDDDQFCTAFGKATEERRPENLCRLSAWNAHDRGRYHQCRPADFHRRLEFGRCRWPMTRCLSSSFRGAGAGAHRQARRATLRGPKLRRHAPNRGQPP